nr:WYL domain-containing protein [Kineococcus vitellinus]
MLSLLQARRDWPGELLAERLRVSRRTVRRDVERLRELGYPVAATRGPEGGYRLGAGAQLPPLLFDDEQAVALAVALRAAAATGTGTAEAAARALESVRQVMPARLRHRLDGLHVTAVPPAAGAGGSPADPQVLLALSAAVRAREVLRFDHAPAPAPVPRAGDGGGPGAPPPPRRVQPHHLLTRGGRWYLLGWDLDREGWRTFRADRITPRSPTGPRFVPREVPGGDVAAFVDGVFKGAGGPGGWPCRGEVLLDLPAAAVLPHAGDGVVEDLGPQRCRLVLGSWSWPALAAAVGAFDADFEVVGPAELRAACAALSHRFAAAAGTGPPRRR